MSWLIESKLHPNTPNNELISRPRLLSLLDNALEKQLVLLRAPAGYGKSTLIGQWYATLDKETVLASWLTLDNSDSDVKQFLSYFILALHSAEIDVGDLITGARNGFEGWILSQVIQNTVTCVNAMDKKCVVVLEDYHNAESKEVNEIVMRLLREVSTQLCLVIDSRTLPELDALSLLVSGAAIEIPASQLKLTEDETVQIFGDSISANDAQNIFTQTEGWMMAVQLAKLERKTRPESAEKSVSQGHFIPLYLTQQVLSGLGDKEREVLLAVSVLRRFNSSLTAHITGQKESPRLIENLRVLSPLIVSLDTEGEWFRLHHLFASYLRELLAEKSAEPNEIRLRASNWCEQQGDIAGAVRYAAEAKNFEECHRIIFEAGGWRIILVSGIGVLRAALRHFPLEQLENKASTLLAKAYLHCKDGEIPEARALLERAWYIEEEKSKDIEIDRLVVESMINIYEDRDAATPEFKRLKKRYMETSKLQPLEHATVAAGVTIEKIGEMRFEEASHALKVSTASMRECNSVLGLNYCYIHAAHIALLKGDVELAQASVSRALTMADENFGSDSGLKNIAELMRYSVKAWTGALPETELSSFERVLVQAMEYDGWPEVYLLGLDAFILSASRFHLESRALSVLKRFRAYAGLYNYSRLKDFVDITMTCLFLSDSSLGVDGSIGYTPKTHKYDEEKVMSSRSWMTYLKEISILPKVENDEAWPARFDTAAKFVRERNLLSHEIMLGVYKAHHYYEANQIEDAEIVMIETIKLAAGPKLMGPFMIRKGLLEILVQICRKYRTSDHQVIEYSFISDILDQVNFNRTSQHDQILSEREMEVLQILGQGKSNKEIARSLELTENTVKFHLKQIFSKLNVNKRTQAIIEARKLRLLR